MNESGLRMSAYIALVGGAIEHAEDSGNKDEALRLGKLVINVAQEYVAKVEASMRADKEHD